MANRSEIDEELEFHLACATEDLVRTGVSRDRARAQAAARFGSRTAVRAACLAVWARPRQAFMLATLVACTVVAVAITTSRDWARVSPFVAVERSAATVIVTVPDQGEFELLAIDGAPIDEILTSCEVEFGEQCDKRFAEDIAEVLEGMGHAPGSTVDLRVRDRDTGRERVLSDRPMTAENRRKVYAAGHP
jgi:hypothetical protein